MLSTKFRFNWLSSFREEDFQKSTNLKQELPVAVMFANESGRNEQSLQRTFHRCFLPSFASFGTVVSEEKIFRNPSIRNKNCLWWPCLLTNQDEMSNLYRGPFIHAFYQISVHLGKRFQRRRFFDFLEINQSEKRMFVNRLELNEQSLQRTFQGCFLPSFDSFGQAVSEEKIFQKSTNQKQEWPVAAMFVNGSGQND